MQFVQFVPAVALLAGNFFFVAVEFAITRARPTMVSDMVSRRVQGARSLEHGVRHIDAYLSACQLGITVCSIGLGITAEPVLAHALEAAFGGGTWLGVASATVAFLLAYAVVSIFHVVIGELAPKSLAIARTERTGLLLAPPMRAFYLLTKPVVDLLNGLGNAVLKPFGIPPASKAGHAPHTEAEIRTLITQSERAGLLDPEEKTFTEGVLSFGDRRAREVMVPRPRVRVLTGEQTVQKAARTAVASRHTRLPLCQSGDGLDTATSFVHVQSLLEVLLEGGQPELQALSEPLLRTSEASLLDELLADMRQQRQHMAVLANEHGTAVGIVTLEDILEQIVGDIRDEYDAARNEVVEWLQDDSVRVPGGASLEEVRAELSLDVEEHREATFGGYLVETAGRIPEPGEVLNLDGWCATIENVHKAAITSALLERIPDEQGLDSPAR